MAGIVIKAILCVFGFAGQGIRTGSIAAWWMAKAGAVAAGSVFAILQSLAMKRK